jgi:hypothetical protein
MSLVAFVLLAQTAHKTSFPLPVPATYRPPFTIATDTPINKTSSIVSIAPNRCRVAWVNGGNYALAKPTACNGVSIVAMTIGVSAKPCSESKMSDFRSLTNSTFFKGDFGFYLGQDAAARCFVVQEMLGKYI